MILKKKIGTNYIISLLVVGLYYYIYRYIFRYNDEGTSPTYSETPNVFKYGKYVLLLLVYSYFILKSRNSVSIGKFGQRVFVCITFFCMVLFLRLCALMEIDDVKLLIVGLLPFIYIKLNGYVLDYSRISRFLYHFFLFSAIYELIQIFLFFSIGRLPALAYEGSISVRFGGAWDDPNSWGIALSFFIPFVYYYCRNIFRRKIMVACGLLMLIVAQSLTAIGAFVFSVSLTEYMIHKNKRVLYLLIVSIILFTIYQLYELFLSNSFIIDYIEMKQGSIDDHSKSIDIFSDLEWHNYLFGVGEPFFNESDYVNMLCFGGIPMLLFYFIISLSTILKLFKIVKRQSNEMALWRGALTFQIAFLVASANLPCTRMFYLYMMFNVFLCISTFNPDFRYCKGVSSLKEPLLVNDENSNRL